MPAQSTGAATREGWRSCATSRAAAAARIRPPVAGAPGNPMECSVIGVAPDRHLVVTAEHSADEPRMKSTGLAEQSQNLHRFAQRPPARLRSGHRPNAVGLKGLIGL